MASEHWDKRYREGETPWDTGVVNGHLPQVLQERDIDPCRALEIGCGTGTNAIWMAQQGFDVTAVDLSGEAIERATKKAEEAGARCRFLADSATTMEIEGDGFGFAWDFGCFHVFDTLWARAALAANVARHLAVDGIWLSVISSADGGPRDSGPPRRTASEILAAVEPHLEIVELRAERYQAGSSEGFEAWRALMRKRREW